MDGLEITETRFADVAKHRYMRMEPDFYVASSGSQANFVLGEDAFKFVQYGTSKGLNEEESGFPVLRLNEFDNCFIGQPSKFCDLIDNQKYEELRLRAGDVLVCRTNGNPKLVGKSAYVARDYNYAFASYLFRVRPREEIISSECLMIYLNSKSGRREIERYSMVSNQANFSPAKLNEIQIPIFNDEFQTTINELVGTAYEKLEQSKDLYCVAEKHLLDELGLNQLQPTTENSAVKSLSESFLKTGRIDAEYYHPEKTRMKGLLDKFPGKTVGSYVTEIDDVINPLNDLESEPLMNFDLNDALPIYLDARETELSDELGSSKKTFKRGDVVVSRLRSYLKEIAIVDTPEGAKTVGSSEFIVLRPSSDQISGEAIVVYLRSLPVQLILKWCQSGSNHPRFAVKDLLAIKVPDIVVDIQETLQSNVRQSIDTSRESKCLLEIAKRAVEIAIEQNVDAAMEYIGQNS